MTITINKVHWVLLGVLATAVPASASAQSVAISFTTTKTATTGFQPKNVLAVWIEKQGGGFVRTVAAYAAARTVDLAVWGAVPGKNSLDAVTGATLLNYGAQNFTWDVRDSKKAVVPNGNYVVKMELSDHNGGSATNNNEASFPVTVGTTKVTTTPANQGGFNSVTLVFDPGAMPDLGTSPLSDLATGTGSPDLSMDPGATMGTGCAMAKTPASSGGLVWSSLGLGLGLLALGRRRRRARSE